MRAAVLGVPAGAVPARARAAWAALPPLYHRWAMTVGGERYLVAERGGRVIGYAARRGAELTAAFVRPSSAGRGVGAALVAAVARQARREGARALRVLAARPAVGFYARLGFRPGRAARAPLPGGLALPARWMRRPLAPPGRTRAAYIRPQGRRNGQRRQAIRSSGRGNASSTATLRAGSASAARIAAMEPRISPWQASSVAGSTATDTRAAPPSSGAAR